jgi:hypothetical protein
MKKNRVFSIVFFGFMFRMAALFATRSPGVSGDEYMNAERVRYGGRLTDNTTRALASSCVSVNPE